ncbi:bacteriocin immunity protein [Pseudomonas sp. NPDC098747]|uniref:bacteriocin immunity protein n=1 Tax=Pseudomonas sp. NPDC098747 TaxID=3364487 RepID=UPI00383A8DC3
MLNETDATCIEDCTEEQFLQFLENFFSPSHELKTTELVRHLHKFIYDFERLTGHSAGYGLLFYPADYGIEGNPEGILKEIKSWRRAHGLPDFRQSHP